MSTVKNVILLPERFIQALIAFQGKAFFLRKIHSAARRKMSRK